MKKIDIKGFPKVTAYEKDDIQTAIMFSLLGASDWVIENLIQTALISTPDFPAEQERDGKKTGKKFCKYVQISFPGQTIPENEETALTNNPEVEFIDKFYESSNNVITYRFDCPPSLDIENDEEEK